jgi:hypothetical protein
MREYMKKALIATLLVISVAFAPCLSSVVDFPDRTSEFARAATTPLFWQFWDELLSRELGPTDSDDCQKSEWAPEFRNALMCLFCRFLFKPAVGGSLSVVGDMTGFSYRIGSASSGVPHSGN